jgi:hypothetical protein
VFFWGPVGLRPGSQFGHVSVAVGDKNYSLGPQGWDTRYPSATDYAARQQEIRASGGTGLVLNLTPAQVARVEASLSGHSGEYSELNNNCTDPIETALEGLGFNLGRNVFPSGLRAAIERTGVVAQTNQYRGTGEFLIPMPSRLDLGLGNH